MRIRARLDDNHRATRDFLEAHGISIHSTASMGSGFPDFVWGYRGVSGLLELKSTGPRGELSSGSKRSLKGEQAFAARWRGAPVLFATSPETALSEILYACQRARP